MNLILILQICVFAILIAEIILPSGGILFILSLGALIWSWIEIIQTGTSQEFLIYGLLDLIGIPALLWLALKLLSRSKFTLDSNLNSNEGYQVEKIGEQELIGQEGLVTQTLRPIGRITLNNVGYEALSENNWIEAGLQVIVTDIQQNKLIVKQKPGDIP